MSSSPSFIARLLLAAFGFLALAYSILPPALALFLFNYGLYEHGRRIW